jgi:hypothetical protein
MPVSTIRFALIVLILLACRTLAAQEAEKGESADFPTPEFERSDLETPAPREIEVKTGEPLTGDKAASARGWGGKSATHVATIQLFRPEEYRRFTLPSLPALEGMAHLGDDPILHSASQQRRRTRGQSLAAILERIPEDQKPDKKAFEVLMSHGMLIGSPPTGPYPESQSILMFGASAEEAEQRARTLIHMLDWGVFRSIQLILYDEWEKLAQQYEKDSHSLEVQQGHVELLEEKLKQYDDYHADMLTSLRLKHMELEIDVAGVKARIGAITRARDKTPELGLQLEEVRLMAEIDLVALEARRTKTEAFLGKVNQKISLNHETAAARAEIGNIESRRRNAVRRAQELVTAIDAYQPPKLVDDAIVIQEIKP